ncbi:vacuolar protein sorting-associated protein IST1, partial [Tremellales sp. Uapishka_1]
MVPWSANQVGPTSAHPVGPPTYYASLRLSIQRLRTLQEKKLALAKKSRREIADLLLKGRIETARLRVEGLIQDDIYVELLELLELYAEKLQARFNLLESTSGTEPEPSVADAVCAIIYAAPRTELKELQQLREILMHKFGRAFALTLVPSDPPPESVPPRIASKLTLYTPARALVDAYLEEIAKGYGVDWSPAPPPGKTDEGEDEGSGKEATILEPVAVAADTTKVDSPIQRPSSPSPQ